MPSQLNNGQTFIHVNSIITTIADIMAIIAIVASCTSTIVLRAHAYISYLGLAA
ncbi:hypothetical protein K2X40_02445 [Candidatus Babeliales bacterium]|nr:hypothetical protein [Candidatus Babeliales bacterium]